MSEIQLRDYQRRMVDFIVEHPRCAMLVFMGAGKGLASLTALERLAFVEYVYPALVLAPKRVAQSTWPDEVKKWAHLRHLKVSVIVGDVDKRRKALAADADIYTVNYEQIPWLIDELGGKWPFLTVIADESTRLKGFRTRQGGKRARALAKVAFRSKRWINLTGTFAPNGVKDTWGQLFFLDRGQRLGATFSAFSDRWFRPGYDGYSLIPLPHAQREIEERISDICFSLTPEENLKLPPLIENPIEIDLPPHAAKIYRDVEREFFAALEGGDIRADMALTRTSKCLQISAGAAYLSDELGTPTGKYEVLHDAKLEALESVVEEAAGAPVLVAYHWKFELELMRKRFGKRVRALDANPRTIDEWNAGRIEILAAHPASAGHGLNLQHGGNILVFLTCWWNLEEHQQIIERIGPTRQAQAGLNRPVFVHRIVARNTLDEDVLDRLKGKADVQTTLMRAMERRNGRRT